LKAVEVYEKLDEGVMAQVEEILDNTPIRPAF